MKLPLQLLSENFVKTRNITEDTRFEICEINAKELLCPERLDLAAKLAYIETRENDGNMEFAKELYEKHIEAFSEGQFSEPGDKNKTSLSKFYTAFDELIEEIKTKGFDEKKSLIPVGRDNIILDGAHRTACAIYFDKKVKIIRFPELEVNFNYEYFRSRRLNEELLQYMAIVYGKYAVKNIYVACLWPVAMKEKRKSAVEKIKKEHRIVLDTDKALLQNGLRNFMLQIYQGQSWIGKPESHFEGVMGKVNACYVPGSSTEIVFFEDGNLDEILEMKDDIRQIFQIDKHAVHISDSNSEARLMIDLLFNNNSIMALNYGKPDFLWEILEKLETLKQFLNQNATLSYFGIRESETMLSEVCMYDEWNPRTYFVFNGNKIPALATVKKSLGKGSVYNEVNKILKQDNANSELRRNLNYFKTKLVWESQKWVLKCKQIAMKITSKIGIYDILHKIHVKIRK